MKNGKKLLCVICMLVFWLSITGCFEKLNIPAETDNKTYETKSLSEFVHILEKYRNGVLANCNGRNLRTQIITFSFAEGNRVYFCTTSDKPMYTQLLSFPYVSYCTFPEDFEPVLSLNGKVVFVEDMTLKERALESNYYAKRNFKSTDNPLLKVFCINERLKTFTCCGCHC